MAIPMILSGAAGRALNTLKPLDDMVTRVDDVLTAKSGWSHGVDFDQRAKIVLDGSWMSVPQARQVINAAGDDITKALGATRKSGLSSELHAASRNLQSKLDPVNGPVTATPADILANGAQVRAGLDELGAAARSTANRRIALGSLALGGGLAGLLALSRGGASDSIPMAPGPIGEHRQPTGTSV